MLRNKINFKGREIGEFCRFTQSKPKFSVRFFSRQNVHRRIYEKFYACGTKEKKALFHVFMWKAAEFRKGPVSCAVSCDIVAAGRLLGHQIKRKWATIPRLDPSAPYYFP